jgi:hypothetical protein
MQTSTNKIHKMSSSLIKSNVYKLHIFVLLSWEKKPQVPRAVKVGLLAAISWG